MEKEKRHASLSLITSSLRFRNKRFHFLGTYPYCVKCKSNFLYCLSLL